MKKKIENSLVIYIIIGMLLIFVSVAGAADRPLRIASGWPAFIDPAVGSDLTSCKLFVNIYDSLVFIDKDRGLPVPHIAKSWDVSDDEKNWTFHLNEGIKFHDGTELTAEDIKFSMDRIITIGEGFAFLFLNRVESTEVVDRYTVTFYLNQPIGPFLGMLGRLYILNKDLVLKNIIKPGPYGDMGDYGKQWLTTHDAGSGPYIVKQFSPEESVIMDLNPDYWKPLDPLVPDTFVVYNLTEPSTIISMLRNREIEIGYHHNAKETLEEADKIEGIDIKRLPQNGIMYWMLNSKKPPTDDVHFRKALAWGIDYETIVNKISVGVTPSQGPIPKKCPGFDPTISNYYLNLDKAKEELEKSKYYGELDKYPVTVYWIDRMPDEEKMVLLFMANMEKLGIKIESVKVPWTKAVEDAGKLETSPNIMTITVNGDYLEAGSLLNNRYSSEAASTWTQNEWLLDPELDAKIDDAIGTIDQEERFTKYSKIIHYVHDDLCASISLFDMALNVPYQSAYVDWHSGESISLMGYEFYLPDIKVDPEKRDFLKSK